MARPTEVTAARLAAFDVLRRIEAGTLSSTALANLSQDLSTADRALSQELVLGVLRWQLFLDRLIEHFANRKIDRLDPSVTWILRLGLYQLRFLSRIPPSAAVNESVKLVGHARLRSAQSFVNAVLRRASRESEYDPITEISDPIERVAVGTSHPAWLIRRWTNQFGADRTRAIAESNNRTPTTAFRVVHSNATQENVFEQLKGEGIVLTPSALTPGAWRVEGGGPILQRLASSGAIYLQDEASQLMAHVLDSQKGDRILDVCAAPGGKATSIADLTCDQVSLVAGDLSARRLKTIVRAVELHRLRGVSLVRFDAEESLPFADESFDRVLVDAPCSGTGTLKRNPEIRWRITDDDISRLTRVQGNILRNAAAVLKVGGRLLYSTCSLERDENEQVVESFLRVNKGFRLVSLPVASELQASPGIARTWPDIQGVDGFFCALLERHG